MKKFILSWLLYFIAANSFAQVTGVKISELPEVNYPLTGAEIVPLVQDGVTKRVVADSLKEKVNLDNTMTWDSVTKTMGSATVDSLRRNPDDSNYIQGLKGGQWITQLYMNSAGGGTDNLNTVTGRDSVTNHTIKIQTDGGTIPSAILETHNIYANAADFYVHSNTNFRAPYLNLYRSRGTQASPTAVQSGSYETTSIGGINFGGYDGSTYFAGATGIYNEPDENWTNTRHGAHLSIYGTGFGANLPLQIIQFGGRDATNSTAITSNIISYRPIAFGNNGNAQPAIYPSGNPAVLAFRTADNSSDCKITAGNATFSGIVNFTTTTNGLVIPNLTKAQRDAIVSPSNGAMIYQTDNTPGLRVYNGTNWMRFTETAD